MRGLGLARPGVKPRGKAQGPLLRPGATGEGKARLGERPWILADASSPTHPGTGCCAGVNRGWPLEGGRRRPGTSIRPRWHRCPRSTEDARAWPHLRRAERGNPCQGPPSPAPGAAVSRPWGGP